MPLLTNTKSLQAFYLRHGFNAAASALAEGSLLQEIWREERFRRENGQPAYSLPDILAHNLRLEAQASGPDLMPSFPTKLSHRRM